MARSSSPLLLSLCIFAILFHSSLGRQQFQQGNECQIDRIDASEPDKTIQAEAGTIEVWDQNRQQFQCAGVAVVRRTIEPKGLLLPFYSNTPQLIYIVQGRGVTGIMFPGCPETFEESQQQGQQGQQGSSQDQHQKIRRFREGDVIAVPAGVAHWSYNDGNEPVMAIVVHDTSSHLNQLDNNPRNFYLAGNPRDEFEQSQQGGRLSRGESEGGRGRRGTSSTCNNLFCGIDSKLIAEAFNVDENVARRLQSENDNRGQIVRVEGELDIVRPPTSIQEESQEQGGRGGGRYYSNGVEETFCSMRLIENIGDPSRADIFTPEAGRVRSLNSHNLPVLQWIQLSAERGVLYNEAIRLPHWNINAHSIVYAIRGQARVQIVNEEGNSVFDGVLQEGQVVTVPQNFAVVKRSQSERFEWVAFKTNDNAMVNSLAGRTSAVRAIPADVLANAWRVSPEEARRVKFNRQETHLASTRGQSRSPGRLNVVKEVINLLM